MDLSAKSFTVMVWIKRHGVGSDEYPFTHGSASGTRQSVRAKFESNMFTFGLGGGENSCTLTQYSSDASVWVHWAATLDKDSLAMLIYRDGSVTAQRVEVGCNSGTAGGSTSSAGAFHIGGYKWSPSTLPFQGSLDEFRVYADRALTAADISSSYNTQVTVDSFLVLSLTFDDTSDLKLDSSCGGSSDATSSTAASTTGKLCGAASATATVCPV